MFEDASAFRSLVENAPQAIVVLRSFDVLYANRAAIKLFCPGDPHTFPPIDRVDQFIAPRALPAVVDLMRRCLEGDDVPDSCEIEGLRLDGATVWLALSVNAVEWAGAPALQASFADVTALKRAEEALEKRMVALTQPLDVDRTISFHDLFNIDEIQRLQDDFAEATGVASIITQVDGTPITKPSKFCRLCRDIIRGTEKGCANCYKSDAALGVLCLDGPTIKPCMSGGLWDAGAGISVGGRHIANWLIGQVRDEVQTEENMRAYARDIGADEDQIIQAFREVPAMSHDKFEKIARALFTLSKQLSDAAYQNVQQARFIAERKGVEDILRKSKEEAEFANRSKTEFLANMSHELRTPLTIINGAFDIIAMEMFGSIDNAKYLDYARSAREAGDHLLGVINDLLDISQIEMNRFELNEEDLDVSEILSSCHLLVKGRAHAVGLGLDLDIGGNVSVLRGDRLRIKQVLLNLLSNAVKFTPKGGKIKLAAKPDPVGGLVFEVADTGIGIDADRIGKALNSLGEVGSPYTREIQGAGIGLPLSKKLVELHGGTLELESEIGIGTKATVRFPAERVVFQCQNA